MPGAKVLKEKEKGGLEYSYVEVMACPGGCTNGGGQIKGGDVRQNVSQKEWLGKVDEAYFSMFEGEGEDERTRSRSGGGDVEMGDARPSNETEDEEQEEGEVINGISTTRIRKILNHWSESTGVPVEKLAYTSYRMVESDVGKVDRSGGQERVVELAGKIGGGW